MGGLAFSQLITLYVTPVIYTYFDDLFTRRTGARAALGSEERAPVTAA